MTKQALTTQDLWHTAKESLVTNFGPTTSVQLSASPFNSKLYLSTTANGSCVDYTEPSFSYNPEEAQFKALMKNVASRATFCRPVRPFVERADRLGYSFINPQTFTPLNEACLGDRFLKPFRPNHRIHWVIGTTFNGHPVYIPEDLVFRGDSKDRIYHANDSGVAAHFDQLTAIKEAVLSRIRADACMRTWYKYLEPYVIDQTRLDDEARARIEYWRANGRELIITQLDNDYGEVFLAVLRGPNHPCFVCGVGATISDETDRAISEAIAAAETNFGVLSGFSGERVHITPHGLRTALDHAIYYSDFEHSQATEFLTARKKPCPPFKRQAIDIIELLEKLNVVVCWLTPPNMTYHVVRVFSPNLVPISYGYGMEHCTHEALWQNSAPVDETNSHVPHCFYRP